MMKVAPKHITPATLDVVVMPNGEIICYGKTVGWVKELGKFISVAASPGVRPTEPTASDQEPP
jgi:hypothetical protein